MTSGKKFKAEVRQRAARNGESYSTARKNIIGGESPGAAHGGEQVTAGTGIRNSPEEAERRAVVAAESWLALVDAGDYGAAWDEAAPFLKTAVTRDELTRSLTPLRSAFGGMKKRTTEKSTYATSLPGAPDGEYVVIQFATTFEHKAAAIETVTPLRGVDGVWRVSGYFVK
jgi:hypothetical protein